MNFPFYDQAPKESVTECNCCGSKHYVLIATRDRYGLDVPVVKCTDCGLIFLSYRMTKEAYREFYEQGHYRRLVAEYSGHPASREVDSDGSPYAGAVSKMLAPHMDPIRGGLLLDLGGSTGLVAAKLAQEYNLDATVVEPSADEARQARDKGLAVAQVPVDEYANGGNHYDLITMCRTIDHLLDIKGALQKVRSWLAPGGLFFVDYVTDARNKIDHPYLLSREVMWRYVGLAGLRIRAEATGNDKRHAAMLCEGV